VQCCVQIDPNNFLVPCCGKDAGSSDGNATSCSCHLATSGGPHSSSRRTGGLRIGRCRNCLFCVGDPLQRSQCWISLSILAPARAPDVSMIARSWRHGFARGVLRGVPLAPRPTPSLKCPRWAARPLPRIAIFRSFQYPRELSCSYQEVYSGHCSCSLLGARGDMSREGEYPRSRSAGPPMAEMADPSREWSARMRVVDRR
jgi:hypothetical protein